MHRQIPDLHVLDHALPKRSHRKLLCEVECAASSSSMLSQRNVLRGKRSSTGTVTSLIRYADTTAAPERRSAMLQSIISGCSIPDFCSQYRDYLFRVRGLAASTRKLHRHVVCRFLTFRFPDKQI